MVLLKLDMGKVSESFWMEYVKNIISVSSYTDGWSPCGKVFGSVAEKY